MGDELLTLCGACGLEIERGALRCRHCGAATIGRRGTKPLEVDVDFDGFALTVRSNDEDP